MHTEYAPAKLNLCLCVGEKLENGYHALQSVMQSISLCDRLFVEKSEDVLVFCPDIPSEQNIVTKAARAFFDYTKIQGGVHIRIEKRIPMEAGLGGGSSDAAAALRALNRIYGAGLSEGTLCDIAATLGADVPFCIRGGCAFAEGVGEKLSPLPNTDLHFVLLFNNTKLSTPAMYRLLDEGGGGAADAVSMKNAVINSDTSCIKRHAGNSFLPLAMSLVPEIKQSLAFLSAHGGAACISGKGPTVFGVFDDEAAARVAAKQCGGIYCKSLAAFE